MCFLLGFKLHGGWAGDVPCARFVSNAEMVSGLVSSLEKHEPGEAPGLQGWM